MSEGVSSTSPQFKKKAWTSIEVSITAKCCVSAGYSLDLTGIYTEIIIGPQSYNNLLLGIWAAAIKLEFENAKTLATLNRLKLAAQRVSSSASRLSAEVDTTAAVVAGVEVEALATELGLQGEEVAVNETGVAANQLELAADHSETVVQQSEVVASTTDLAATQSLLSAQKTKAAVQTQEVGVQTNRISGVNTGAQVSGDEKSVIKVENKTIIME